MSSCFAHQRSQLQTRSARELLSVPIIALDFWTPQALRAGRMIKAPAPVSAGYAFGAAWARTPRAGLAAAARLGAVTFTRAVICGWIEQMYLYTPAFLNV